jgi:Putative zinc finger protein
MAKRTIESSFDRRGGQRTYNIRDEDSDDDYEENFYENYEPCVGEEFDDDEYVPLVVEDDYEVVKSPVVRGKVVKPFSWLGSPIKSPVIKSVDKSTFWDKDAAVAKPVVPSNRMVNGVMNYAALLPPPTPKVETAPNPKKARHCKERNGTTNPKKPVVEVEGQSKPNRFCISVTKKIKCFHGKKCRFAHEYSQLKECNFDMKCRNVKVVKTNPDGTVELTNKVNAFCNFRHSTESKNSYLKRVVQDTVNVTPRKSDGKSTPDRVAKFGRR